METQTMVALPKEVQELSNLVTIEKREEVNNVLNQIFAGTADWKAQVDAIEVKGIDDVMSIKLADTARLNAKNARLQAEKTFDAKRDEVQAQMQSYQTEDKLWLKAKQTMQILFKEIEDSAKYKAEYVKRYEAEQKELKTLQRINRVQIVNPDLHRSEFENMSDETFEIFISGIEKANADRIEAERLAEEKRIEDARIEAERIEAQRIENERLKKEAEIKEAELKKEREQVAEQQRLAKIEADKAIAEANRLAKIEADKQTAILEAQRKETARIQAELRAKQDAEIQAQKEREAQESLAKKEAEKLAKAPIKKQLQTWVNSFDISETPKHEKADLIKQKFEAFKKWALTEIDSI